MVIGTVLEAFWFIASSFLFLQLVIFVQSRFLLKVSGLVVFIVPSNEHSLVERHVEPEYSVKTAEVMWNGISECSMFKRRRIKEPLGFP